LSLQLRLPNLESSSGNILYYLPRYHEVRKNYWILNIDFIVQIYEINHNYTGGCLHIGKHLELYLEDTRFESRPDVFVDFLNLSRHIQG
jgi:hypothetical protein